MEPRPTITPALRRLVYAVAAGAILLAAIGFVGSYAAVRELAERKGFGRFSLVFPIGIDAGIGVLLALDLVLTWLRMPYPLLRPAAWILTVATIAFNGAAAWPDPLGVGMHAVIPLLFIVVVEAGRHAVGRIADITADKHMEGVRLTRWLLSPIPTFKLWRRMKLWELRSYEQIIKLEQDRLIYQARLQARYGRRWRRKAPIEMLMPLRLARYGRPLTPLNTSEPEPAVTVDPGASATFDMAAAEAVALAPPTAPALTAAAPAALGPGTSTTAAQSPAPAAQPEPDAQPDPAVTDADTDPQPDAQPPPGVLVLDLAPMDPPHPAVTRDTEPAVPQPQPEPPVQPQPPVQPGARVSDAALIDQAVILARTGALSLRRVQSELRIGQRRAQRIIPAAESRIRAALAESEAG
ncbi:DUF2637 domain-containing protein [Streptomyces sp. NPDC058280]|uniref:DUF2637 domain-containing protein n=1 Tax=Streptomyces sp. NPDC058280 TaxID=3346419 RepID=UPI0036E6A499